MKIIKATVQLTNMTDEVYLRTDLPCPFHYEAIPSQPPLDLHFKASYNTGIEYVRRVFGIEPEVINSRSESLSPRGFGK